jgi:hypothetical protein
MTALLQVLLADGQIGEGVHTVRTDPAPFASPDLVPSPYLDEDRSASRDKSRVFGAGWTVGDDIDHRTSPNRRDFEREVRRVASMFPVAQRESCECVLYEVLYYQVDEEDFGVSGRTIAQKARVMQKFVSQYLNMIGAIDALAYPLAAGPRGVELPLEFGELLWRPLIMELSRSPLCVTASSFAVAREVLACEQRSEVLPDCAELSRRCGVPAKAIPNLLHDLAPVNVHRKLAEVVKQEAKPWTDVELDNFWDGRSGPPQTIAGLLCIAAITNQPISVEVIADTIGIKVRNARDMHADTAASVVSFRRDR